MAFKLGISLVSIAEIVGLLYVAAFGAIREYDPVHQETIGLILILIAVAMACVMFLVIVFFTMKWKGTAATDRKSTENAVFGSKTEG